MAGLRPLPLTRPRVLLAILAAAGAFLVIGAGAGAPGSPAAAQRAAPRALAGHRPNIVFVLTDDLSMNLLRYMPRVQAMERDGLTLRDYFVSDSLCCPSRSSIFTGDLPHDTHVFSNFGPDGGFNAFHTRGEERHTFAVALRQAGYATAMMGKYLNGYLSVPGSVGDGAPAVVSPTYVPPGWSEWDVAGFGYPEFNYTLNENGTLHGYGNQPSDYLTDVIAGKGVDFIDRSARAGRPFFLELATFAPHAPYTPAPRDAAAFPGLAAPRPPSFDVLPAHAPRWLAIHHPLSAAQIGQIDSAFGQRVRAVQAVDRLIGRVEQALAADHVAANTYVVFSSDNGLHTGEYRLMPGKMTAFDTDIHVPLVVVGPDVAAGTTSTAMAENIDLAKTFSAIGGTSLPGDGRSLLPLIGGSRPADWRNAILVEHHGPDRSGSDPDYQQPAAGDPRSYEAMRTHRYLYVEYNSGEREFYDLRVDPFELNNLAGTLTAQERVVLHNALHAMEACHGGPACWSAMHVAPLH